MIDDGDNHYMAIDPSYDYSYGSDWDKYAYEVPRSGKGGAVYESEYDVLRNGTIRSESTYESSYQTIVDPNNITYLDATRDESVYNIAENPYDIGEGTYATATGTMVKAKDEASYAVAESLYNSTEGTYATATGTVVKQKKEDSAYAMAENTYSMSTDEGQYDSIKNIHINAEAAYALAEPRIGDYDESAYSMIHVPESAYAVAQSDEENDGATYATRDSSKPSNTMTSSGYLEILSADDMDPAGFGF